MQSVVVSAKANFLAKRARVRNERRGTTKDEPSPSNLKIDSLTIGIEKLMDRIENMERKPQWDNQQAPLVRNPNFRKNQKKTIVRMDLIKILGLLFKRVM